MLSAAGRDANLGLDVVCRIDCATAAAVSERDIIFVRRATSCIAQVSCECMQQARIR